MKYLIAAVLLFTSLKISARTPDFVVAKDGSGDFQTVQEAINAVPDFRKNETIIFIKNGAYKEKLILSDTKTNVHFRGESVEGVILTYDDYASKHNIFGEEMGTTGSASFFIHGEGFTADNITFENSAGQVGQAVAVRVAADKVRFFNCRFLGNQDTLYTWGYGAASRQYYKNCYIEGTVDFIFGASTAVFDQCKIFGKNGGYYTAASTPEDAEYGYVFLDCELDGNAPKASFYLGRPWRPYAQTVFIRCEMSEVVRPVGWHNWGKEENEKTVFYAEYKSEGPGAQDSVRAPWSKQLSSYEAEKYNLKKIFEGWEVEVPTK